MILNLPIIGANIATWENEKSLSPRVKVVAMLSFWVYLITACFFITILAVKILLLVLCTAATIWVYTRPTTDTKPPA